MNYLHLNLSYVVLNHLYSVETTFAWLHYLISQMNWLIATAADTQWVFKINFTSFSADKFWWKKVG